MKVTYLNSSIPEPVNEYMSYIGAPNFSSGSTVIVDGVQGVISRIAWDKSWMDIHFSGWSKRLYWHKERKEYFGKKDIAPVEG